MYSDDVAACDEGSPDVKTNLEVQAEQIEHALQTGTLLPGSILDLRKNNHLNRIGRLFQAYPYPPNLIFDFGDNPQHGIGIESLIKGLSAAHASPGIELLFGTNGLTECGFTVLMRGLTFNKMQPGLTLTLSNKNLSTIDETRRSASGSKKMFYLLIDTITSGDCIPWLTVDLSQSFQSPEDMAYLANALKTQKCTSGFFIKTSSQGTFEQRIIINLECERVLRLGQKQLGYRQLDPTLSERELTTIEILLAKSKETQAHIHDEKFAIARAGITQHLSTLTATMTSFNTKERRIAPFKSLLEAICTLGRKTLTQILLQWEIDQTNGISNQDAISHDKPFWHSMFKSMTKPKTSSEILIDQLKALDQYNAPKITQALSYRALEIRDSAVTKLS